MYSNDKSTQNTLLKEMNMIDKKKQAQSIDCFLFCLFVDIWNEYLQKLENSNEAIALEAINSISSRLMSFSLLLL